jgi:hypothetical protein
MQVSTLHGWHSAHYDTAQQWCNSAYLERCAASLPSVHHVNGVLPTLSGSASYNLQPVELPHHDSVISMRHAHCKQHSGVTCMCSC